MASYSRIVLACLIVAIAIPRASQAQVLGSPDAATVVAKQGDVSVTLGDVDAYAQRIPQKDRAVFFDNPKRLETIITNLLLSKHLAAEARAKGLEKVPAVRAQIALATDDVLGKVLVEQMKADMKVPDMSASAHEDYVGHKEKYTIVGRLDVKHVLISTKSHTDSEAKAIADTVEKEARADPDKFDALVDKYSEDPSKASNQGLMPDAGGDKYVSDFSAAAKKLTKPGQISPVVKTNFGYHVLQLVQRTQDRVRPYAEVQPELEARLASGYVDKAIKDHTDQLRSQPLEGTPDVVESLRTRYGVAPSVPNAPPTPATAPVSVPQ